MSKRQTAKLAEVYGFAEDHGCPRPSTTASGVVAGPSAGVFAHSDFAPTVALLMVACRNVFRAETKQPPVATTVPASVVTQAEAHRG
jgi:hypothetical protein